MHRSQHGAWSLLSQPKVSFSPAAKPPRVLISLPLFRWRFNKASPTPAAGRPAGLTPPLPMRSSGRAPSSARPSPLGAIARPGAKEDNRVSNKPNDRHRECSGKARGGDAYPRQRVGPKVALSRHKLKVRPRDAREAAVRAHEAQRVVRRSLHNRDNTTSDQTSSCKGCMRGGKWQ